MKISDLLQNTYTTNEEQAVLNEIDKASPRRIYRKTASPEQLVPKNW